MLVTTVILKNMENTKPLHSLPSALRQLIFVNRAIGLAPVSIKTDDSGKCYISSSIIAQIYSCIIVLSVHAGVFFLETRFNPYWREIDDVKMYISARILVSTLVAVSCWIRLPRALEAFNAIHRLGDNVPPSKLWAALPALFLLLCLGDEFVWFMVTSGEITIKNVSRSAFVELVPEAVCSFATSQFVFHVHALNMAWTGFNRQVSAFLEEQNILYPKQSLRAVMRKQQHLWKTCRLINAAYGEPLLFIAAGAFLEGTLAVILSTQFHPLKDIVVAFGWACLCNIPLAVAMHNCQISNEKSLACQDKCNELKVTSNELQINLEVFEWEVQLRHQKLEYSASGYFNLNGRQFMSMVCTIISFYFCTNWIFGSRTETGPRDA